ncbi:MAG: hypothetical protein ABIO16_17970 [Nocardioides sp.]
MTVDDLARRAGADLRAAVEENHVEVVEHRLSVIPTAYRRRRRHAVATVASAAVAVAALGVGGVWLQSVTDGTAPAPSSPAPSNLSDACAKAVALTCRADGGFAVHAAVPYSFEVPPSFGFPATDYSPDLVDLVQDSGEAGVAIMEDPRPQGDARPGDAQALATWIATRPYLEASTPYAVDVDGLRAWKVDARLLGDAVVPRKVRCNQVQSKCHALLVLNHVGWQVGVWRGMVTGFSVVDLPQGHTMVIWQWAFDPDQAALRANDAVVAGLRLGARAGG